MHFDGKQPGICICLWFCLLSETSPQTWYSVEGDIIHSGRLHMPSTSFSAISSDFSNLYIPLIIIQQIVTLSKYGHDALDICHP